MTSQCVINSCSTSWTQGCRVGKSRRRSTRCVVAVTFILTLFIAIVLLAATIRFETQIWACEHCGSREFRRRLVLVLPFAESPLQLTDWWVTKREPTPISRLLDSSGTCKGAWLPASSPGTSTLFGTRILAVGLDNSAVPIAGIYDFREFWNDALNQDPAFVETVREKLHASLLANRPILMEWLTVKYDEWAARKYGWVK